jgi:hypothetical protein
MKAARNAVTSVTMTLYQGNHINWQITVATCAPTHATASVAKIQEPDRVLIHAGAFSGRCFKMSPSLARQSPLILSAPNIRKNFQFHNTSHCNYQKDDDQSKVAPSRLDFSPVLFKSPAAQASRIVSQLRTSSCSNTTPVSLSHCYPLQSQHLQTT